MILIKRFKHQLRYLKLKPTATILCLSLVAYYIGGFTFAIHQDAYYLPKLNLLIESRQNIYPDLYLDSLRYYLTYTYHLLAPIALATSPKIGFQIFHFFSITTFITAIYLLTQNWLKHNLLLTLLATLFLLLPKPALGGISLAINPNYFYQSFLALSLSLLALALYQKNKHTLSFGLVGFILNLHAISAVPVFVLLLTLSYSHSNLTKLLKYTLITLLLGSPAILTYFLIQQSNPPIPFQTWLVINQLRSSAHLFPATWHATQWLKMALYLLPILLTIKLAPSNISSFLKRSLIAITILCSTGYIFTTIFPIKLIITLQLFRSSLLLVFLGWLTTAYLLTLLFGLKSPLIKITTAFITTILVINTLKPYINHPRIQFSLSTHDQNWLDTQLWLKHNTAPNHKAFVPPYLPSFRALSQRPANLTWADTTASAFSNQIALQTHHLLNTYQIDPIDSLNRHQSASDITQQLKNNFYSLTPEKIIQIAQRSNAHYIILESNFSWQQEPLYNNAHYSIYPL